MTRTRKEARRSARSIGTRWFHGVPGPPALSTIAALALAGASLGCSDGQAVIGAGTATQASSSPPDAGSCAVPAGASATPRVPSPFDAADVSPASTWPECEVGGIVGARDAWIVFDADQAAFNRDLYAMHPDGTGLTRLTDAPGLDREPSVSCDGKLIAFTSDRDGTPQIYLMTVADRRVKPLTHRPEGATAASFSNDGSRLVFHAGLSAYVIGVEGTGEAQVIADLGAAASHPRFIRSDAALLFESASVVSTLDFATARVSNFLNLAESLGPAASPGGEEFVYSFQGPRDAAKALWVTPWGPPRSPVIWGEHGQRITPPDDASSEHAAWGPGDVLAYERVVRGTNVARLALLSRAPGSTPCLLGGTTADSRDPTWVTTPGFTP